MKIGTMYKSKTFKLELSGKFNELPMKVTCGKSVEVKPRKTVYELLITAIDCMQSHKASFTSGCWCTKPISGTFVHCQDQSSFNNYFMKFTVS